MMNSLTSEVDGLAAAITRSAVGREGTFIVAIDGRSGSGKSTLASRLAALLDAQVIEGDDFYAGGTTVRQDHAASRAEACIDWRRLRVVLATVRNGGEASWHPFDWERFDGSLAERTRSVSPGRILLLEGVYASRPELADLVDFHVLVDVPASTRWARLMAREGELGPWERQWHEAEEHYFNVTLATRRFDAFYRE